MPNLPSTIAPVRTGLSPQGRDSGPGTRYVEESHYNPATKTVITDWMCVV